MTTAIRARVVGSRGWWAVYGPLGGGAVYGSEDAGEAHTYARIAIREAIGRQCRTAGCSTQVLHDLHHGHCMRHAADDVQSAL